MSREATDQLYIELGYYYPEEYYTYEAVAASAIASSATVSCDATKLGAPIEASASLSSTTAISSTVSVTKQTNVGLSAQTTTASTAGRIVSVSADFQGAFTPSMTVIAYKNHTAALQSITVINITASVNRSSSMALANIANLDAQAAKTATVDSTMATQSAITAAAITIKQSAQADLNTQSTVAANAGKLKITSTALASRFTIPPTTRYFGTGRPRNLSGGTTSTAQKKFGSYSLSSSDTAVANNQVNAIPNQTEDFVFEGWVYGGSGLSGTVLSFQDIANARNAFIRLSLDVNGVLTFTRYVGPTGSATTYTHTSALSAAWHHILIAKDTGRISLFIDGTRAYTSTSVGASIWTGYGSANQQININPRNRYLDEFSLNFGTTLGFDPSSSTITVPTVGRLNDPATTVFLYHFENNLNDDLSVLAEASASIAAASAISATPQPLTKSAAASVAADAQLQVTVNRLVDAASTISSTAAQTTAGLRVRTAQSTQSAQSAVTVIIGSVKPFASDFISAFTPALTVVARLAGVALLENTTALTADVVKTVDVSSDLSSQTVTSAQITMTQGGSADLALDSAMSATVTRIQATAVDLQSQSAITATAYRTQIAQADLNSQSTTATTASRTRSSAIDVLAAADLSALGDRTRSTEVAVAATTATTATVTRIQASAATVVSQSAITAQAVKTVSAVTVTASNTAVATQAVKTVVTGADFQGAFTPLMSANLTARPLVYLESTSALTAIIGSIKQFEPELPISGVQFQDSTLIKIRNTQPAFLPDQDSDFAISFWANAVTGTVLSFYPFNVNGNRARIRFAAGTVIFDNYTGTSPTPNDQRFVTWTVDTAGWHHYLFYKPGSSSTVSLYQDGVVISGTVTTIDDGNSPPLPPSNDFLYRDNTWIIGANTSYWQNSINELTNAARSIVSMQGGITQFVAYWTTLPDFSDSVQRQRLYDQGFVDLGPAGTASGLLQPDIYLRLSQYDDYLQRGTVTDRLVEWRQVTETGYDPTWDNLNWSLTSAYTSLPTDTYSPGMSVTATLTAGFIGVFQYQVEMISRSALAAAVVRIHPGQSDMAVVSDIITEAVKQTGTVQTLSSDSELTTIIGKIIDFDIAVAGQSAISAVVGLRNELLPTTLTATSTLAAVGDVILPIRTSADLAATATVSATVVRQHPGSAVIAATATVQADVTLIPPLRTSAVLEATTALTAEVNRTRDFATLNQSSGTIAVTAEKTARITQELVAQTALTADPQNIIGIVADLQMQGFQLTAGDVINIDPFLTLTITPETRTIVIYQETRTLTVDQESRILTLGGY